MQQDCQGYLYVKLFHSLSGPADPHLQPQTMARPSTSSWSIGVWDALPLISISRPTPSTSSPTHRWAVSTASHGKSSTKRMFFPCPFVCLHVDVDLSHPQSFMENGRLSEFIIPNIPPLVPLHLILTVPYIPPSFSRSPGRPRRDVRLLSSTGSIDRYHPSPLSLHISHAQDALVEPFIFSNTDDKYIRGSCLWSTTPECM